MAKPPAAKPATAPTGSPDANRIPLSASAPGRTIHAQPRVALIGSPPRVGRRAGGTTQSKDLGRGRPWGRRREIRTRHSPLATEKPGDHPSLQIGRAHV